MTVGPVGSVEHCRRCRSGAPDPCGATRSVRARIRGRIGVSGGRRWGTRPHPPVRPPVRADCPQTCPQLWVDRESNDRAARRGDDERRSCCGRRTSGHADRVRVSPSPPTDVRIPLTLRANPGVDGRAAWSHGRGRSWRAVAGRSAVLGRRRCSWGWGFTAGTRRDGVEVHRIGAGSGRSASARAVAREGHARQLDGVRGVPGVRLGSGGGHTRRREGAVSCGRAA